MDDYITVKRQFVLDAINIGLSGYISDDDKLTLEGMGIAVSEMPTTDLSGYSDRLWKSAYDRGYARCKDDVIEALIEKGQASKRYSLSEEWELNYTEICDVIEDLPSAQPEKSTTEEKSQLAEEKSTRKLIYLDEAIDVAKQHWYKPDIAKALEELPSAQTEQRWIPVSETVDVPEHEVLACDKYGTELIGFLAGADGRYECESDECIMYDVVAWMPLPEPYKGETK